MPARQRGHGRGRLKASYVQKGIGKNEKCVRSKLQAYASLDARLVTVLAVGQDGGRQANDVALGLPDAG